MPQFSRPAVHPSPGNSIDPGAVARNLMAQEELTPAQFEQFRRLVGAGGQLPPPDRGVNYSTAAIRQWMSSGAIQTRVALPLTTR